MIGVVGNEIAAQVRLRGGRRIGSAALIADGKHARVDGVASGGVIASALCVAVGIPTADPLIGLAITAVLIKVTWDSWKVISADTAPGAPPGDARGRGLIVRRKPCRAASRSISSATPTASALSGPSAWSATCHASRAR